MSYFCLNNLRKFLVHLVSGARDGSILCWDLRTPPSRKLVKEGSLRYINSYRTYPETHGGNLFCFYWIKIFLGSFSVSTPTKKIQQRNPYSITGINIENYDKLFISQDFCILVNIMLSLLHPIHLGFLKREKGPFFDIMDFGAPLPHGYEPASQPHGERHPSLAPPLFYFMPLSWFPDKIFI